MDLRKGLLSAKPGLLQTDVQGETVLLDAASGKYFGLEGAATPVWRLLSKGPASFEALADAIVSEYDVPRDRAEADLRAFLEQMLKEGLVVPA